MRDRLTETEGNAAYLVLYTGDRSAVEERFLTACSHFGIPFRVRKTEPGTNWASEFDRCSGVLLTGRGTLMSLGSQGLGDLAAALDNGTGLVSFDTGFDSMDSLALKILGVENPGSRHFVTRVLTSPAGHPVTAERQKNDVVVFDRSVSVPSVETRHTRLLESEDGNLLCLVRDDRKVVTFCMPDDIWSLDVCGHCGMLDDVFYRAIVWAAKKPFLTFRLPPLACAIVDDCVGSYNHFSYVDTMNKYGWKPHLALFFAGIDEVAHDDKGADSRKIKILYEDRLAEFGPHAIRYNHLFGFDHLARRPFSEKQLEENFIFHDKKIGDWGIKPSRLAHMHFGEAGANSLPFLEQRGYEYFTRLLPFDVSWFDVPGKIPHLKPQWPYGHSSYCLSVMPENPRFFQPLAVAGNKTRESADFPVNADYLWNRTYFWGENDHIDIDGAVETVVLQIRQALSSGFFGMASTHEQRIAVMHPAQWDELWAKAADRLSFLDFRFCLLEEAMGASRDLFRSCISSLIRCEGGLNCVLNGQAENAVELQLFREDRHTEPEPVVVDAFNTQKRIVI